MAAGPRTERLAPVLSGVTVVECGDGPALALAGMLLCDAGATVAKLESPEGATERAGPSHRVWNRGKQSVVLDPARPGSDAEFRSLLDTADAVIVQAPRDCAEAVIGSLPAAVVACQITSFGSKGPLAGIGGDDASVAAYSGMCAARPAGSRAPPTRRTLLRAPPRRPWRRNASSPPSASEHAPALLHGWRCHSSAASC